MYAILPVPLRLYVVVYQIKNECYALPHMFFQHRAQTPFGMYDVCLHVHDRPICSQSLNDLSAVGVDLTIVCYVLKAHRSRFLGLFCCVCRRKSRRAHRAGCP